MSLVPPRPSGSPERLSSCRAGLDALLESNSVATVTVPLLSDSSSAVNLEAVKLLRVFHGGDTGNFDQCTEMMGGGFHHCLAGSTDRNWTIGVIVSPFAGICVPSACGPAELQGHLLQGHITGLVNSLRGDSSLGSLGKTQVMRYLRTVNETLSIADYLDTRMTCGNHTYPPTYEDVGSSAWATAVALAFFVAAAAVSVVVRAYGPRWCSNAQHREPGGVSGQHEQAMNARAQQTASRYGAVDADDMVAPDRTDGTLPLKDDAQPPNPGEGFEGKDSDGDYGGVLLRAFDFGVNFKRLFTVDDGNRGEFRALDGLRVLSILWVILGHSLAELNEVGFSNPTNALPPNGLTHEVGAQLFFSARLAVDTFLLLSGFLVTLGMLRRFGFPADSAVVAKASPSWHKWVPAFYLNRVLRILPLYAACLGFFWKIAPSLYSGPFWFAWDGYVDKCERLWWTNLLFINNIVPSDGSETDGCFYWAWYLALDMQFAVFLAPPALCLYFKSSRHGGVFVLACLVASVAAGFWYSLQTGISASSFDGIWVGEYSRKFYTKPWFRAPPYLVGIYTAMLWMDKEGSGLRGGNDTWNCFRDFFPTAVGGGNRKRSPSAGWCIVGVGDLRTGGCVPAPSVPVRSGSTAAFCRAAPLRQSLDLDAASCVQCLRATSMVLWRRYALSPLLSRKRGLDWTTPGAPRVGAVRASQLRRVLDPSHRPELYGSQPFHEGSIGCDVLRELLRRRVDAHILYYSRGRTARGEPNCLPYQSCVRQGP
jgi:hypothetical protein